MENTIIKNLSFTKRNIPIPADYRPLYKIGHLIMILNLSCRSQKASLMKLHFLCWALKSIDNMHQVSKWISNDFQRDYHIWGVEPTVNRALDYAISEGYISLSQGDYQLTDSGSAMYKIINRDKELFLKEKAFLLRIGKNIVSEKRIKELSGKFL